MIIWALFDSGNGCYKQVADNIPGVKIYSIGLDILNKNEHFINLNLADYSYLFGNNKIWETLENLPKPDLIIASPPCESWSVASAMKDGNACWKREYRGESLFVPQLEGSNFTIRNFDDYKNTQFKPERQLIKRINGELCAINTIRIIERYKPKFYVVENPATSKIWEYFEKIIGFHFEFENRVRYNNYDYPIQKPTKFSSNVDLGLNNEFLKNNNVKFNEFSRNYNERSNIPLKLVKEIFEKIKDEYERNETK